MPIDDALAHALDYADRWLAYRRWRLRIPGVQLAVRVGGELVLDTAHGVTDASTGETLTARHRFRIASHSKTLASLTMLRLVEEGRLRLDDTLGAHLPELADTDAGALQLRELLSHGAGVVRDSGDVAFWHLQAPFPDTEGLRAIARSGVHRLPASTEFKYSNIGFGLLGLVVESVTGTPYGEALEAHVLAPIGRDDVLADLPAGATPEGLVTGHAALHSSDERVPLASAATAQPSATASACSCARSTAATGRVTVAPGRARRRARSSTWSATWS